MDEITSKITDAELLQKLQKSYIDDEQKKELETLIPEMNAEERSSLFALINEAQAEKDRVQPIYDEGLGKINEEYTDKLNTLVKEETKKAFKEVEEAEDKENAEEMKDFETEITDVEPAPEDKPTKVKNDESKEISKKKHGLRNFVLILLLLVLIAGSALLAISYL